MARPGRKTNDPAKNRLGFLFTDRQVDMLDKCAYELRMTRTDVVRKGIEKMYQEVFENEK